MNNLADLTAHVVSDLRECMHWISIGLFSLAVYSFLKGLIAIADERWVSAGMNGFCLVVFAFACREMRNRLRWYERFVSNRRKP